VSPPSHFALGRLKTGAMNRTEAAYDAHLRTRSIAGEVVWYKFEAVKFRLADNTFYTPDFAVMVADGHLEMHEVKGNEAIFADDAKVKIKVAAELYPFRFVAAFPVRKRDGGGWRFTEY
jgi:hypothetical protein